MVSITVHVDDKLYACASRELEKLGVTHAELMLQALQYVAEGGCLPFQPDSSLTALVRERLANPQRTRILLEDL